MHVWIIFSPATEMGALFSVLFFSPSLERVSVCWSEPKNEDMQNMPFLLPFNIHTLVFLGFTADT